MTIASTTGWQLGELEQQSAGEVVRYAVTCLEHEGQRLLREIDLFTLPLDESKERKVLKGLHKTAARWMDVKIGSAGLQQDEQQRLEEEEYVHLVCQAAARGDFEEEERLNMLWEQKLERRKEAGETMGAPTEISGGISLLTHGDRLAQFGLVFNSGRKAG